MYFLHIPVFPKICPWYAISSALCSKSKRGQTRYYIFLFSCVSDKRHVLCMLLSHVESGPSNTELQLRTLSEIEETNQQ